MYTQPRLQISFFPQFQRSGNWLLRMNPLTTADNGVSLCCLHTLIPVKNRQISRTIIYNFRDDKKRNSIGLPQAKIAVNNKENIPINKITAIINPQFGGLLLFQIFMRVCCIYR